jgi:soluble lytic murein transglycosylase
MVVARSLRILLLLALAVVWAARAAAGVFTYEEEQQRRDFQAALEALRAGDLAGFRALRERLDGYVLRGYLDYEYLKDRLASTPSAEIRRFLAENEAAPISDFIRKKWLRLLAARGDWQTFLAEYRAIEDDPELQCLRLDRLLRTSEAQAELMQEVEKLWRNGRRLPAACQRVFDHWRRAGHMSAELIWERIRLAVENGELSLAGELAHYLPAGERVWVRRWQAMHRDPLSELKRLSYPVETPVARRIVTHGVVRLAFRDPQTAMDMWQTLKARHQFFGEDENYVLRYIGLLAAQDDHPQALEWLSMASADPRDLALAHWRVRAALRAGQWETALRFIAALPEEERRQSQWRYWQARALEESGRRAEARQLYQVLAGERSYYGFLAADRIGTEYSMQHAPIEATPEEVSALLARPGIQMARELYLLGRINDARRQWHWAIRNMNNRELAVAAVIAREWGWYDRAILTAGQGRYFDDLELRFPLLYREVIETTARRFEVDPSWVYGLVRQESAFVTDARSPAGALGLMQLLPSTGRFTARLFNVPWRSNRTLLDVEHNVRLGVGYLRHVLDRYDGHQVLATAAYNAGPNRIRPWLPAQAALPADVWIETIPLSETRDYVKNVLAYTAVYEHRLGAKPTRLQTRMPAVAGTRSSQ